VDAASRRLLTGIHDEQRRYGEEIPPPADADELAALTAFVLEQTGAPPPAAYLAFLGVANGLDANGTTIYACRERRRPDGSVQFGLPEQNRGYDLGPEAAGRLLLGETGDELFVVDVRTGRARVVDKVSLHVFEEFDDAEGLLRHALRAAAGG
jgi:hypothetical protein